MHDNLASGYKWGLISVYSLYLYVSILCATRSLCSAAQELKSEELEELLAPCNTGKEVDRTKNSLPLH